MRIEFEQSVKMSPAEAYACFRSPESWACVSGVFGKVAPLADGWFSLSLAGFPVPLRAKITREDPYRRVAWKIAGFFEGEGEVSFEPTDDGVIVFGYERLEAKWLPLLAPMLERLYLERRFRKLWAHGLRRLRRLGESGEGAAEAA